MDFSNFSWDDSAPISLDDPSFYALLQKQIATTTNPQSLLLDPTKFPAPPADNLTPPLSEESSPSPPDGNDQGNGDDDGHKRKADDVDTSDDESTGQPSHKSQHRSGGGGGTSKKGSSRRKSGGNQDESRLLKRKEQNRAAQRAFRERKEKHVKDLEEQVSDLEMKTESQAIENENLRDLLSRLQNENLLLKQSSFTFSFPQGATTSNTTRSNADSPSSSNSPPGTLNLINAPASSSTSGNSPAAASSSGSTPSYQNPSTLFSNISLFNNTASPPSSRTSPATPPASQFTPPLFANLSSFPDFSTPSSTFDFSNLPDFSELTSMDASSGYGGGKYTTIAANPMFTSYSDPLAQPNAWASFGPIGDYDMNSAYPTESIVNRNTESSASNTNNGSGNGSASLEDLFGLESFIGGPFSTAGSSPPALSSSGSSPQSQPPATAPQDTSKNADAQMANGTASSSSVDQHCADQCPNSKEEVAAIINKSSPATFGPPVTVNVKKPSPATAGSYREPSTSSPMDGLKPCENTPPEMRSLLQGLPCAEKSPTHVEITKAWDHVRKHPQFNEADIDELCAELSSKAKCDGSRSVVEKEAIVNVMQRISSRGSNSNSNKK